MKIIESHRKHQIISSNFYILQFLADLLIKSRDYKNIKCIMNSYIRSFVIQIL